VDFILFEMQEVDRVVYIWAELEHQYVLPFYGTVTGFGPSRALVSPWMLNGNLMSYLNRADLSLTETDRLSLVSFICKACLKNLPYFKQLRQITEGLKYRE